LGEVAAAAPSGSAPSYGWAKAALLNRLAAIHGDGRNGIIFTTRSFSLDF